MATSRIFILPPIILTMIQTACPISLHSQAEYHELDHLVTGLAFVMHNEMGRFLDERLYQHELTARCRMAGLTVHPEMMITVSCEDFIKKYFVDSLLAEGVVIETKTVQTLIAAHKAQALNYLFLCGTHHGTLLNFRPARVQHEFVSTRLSPADRHRFTLHMDGWQPLGAEWERLHEVMVCLLKDWGAFLDPHLYREALTHFLGGAAHVIRKVPVTTANGYIGDQELHLLSPSAAFAITAVTRHPEEMAAHQQRFLRLTPLSAIAWINLNRHQIEFKTITR